MSAGMVIVGAGEAGARAASALRAEGFDGAVTIVGDEEHGPYERPPLSKAVMTAAEEIGSPPLILDEAKLAAADIRHVANARVERIDVSAKAAILSSGESLPYAKLLIATGAHPRRLAVTGASDGNVLYLRTFADALRLRSRLRVGSRLVVIGGGFIGLEIAASAIERGCAVTLVEMAPRILMRGVPPEVATLVRERHEQAGVAFRTGTGIEKIERRGDGEAVVLADGTVLDCDLVVAGIGAVPETTLAEASGLAVENGVKVDGRLCTSDPDIFAAGDCCSFPHPLYGGRRLRLEAWRNAQDQGALAARNMLGGTEEFDAVPWFWSDQYDQGLQVAGMPDEGRALVARENGDARMFFHLDDEGRLVAVSAIGPGNAISRDMKLAERLISRRWIADPSALASPGTALKSLLK